MRRSSVLTYICTLRSSFLASFRSRRLCSTLKSTSDNLLRKTMRRSSVLTQLGRRALILAARAKEREVLRAQQVASQARPVVSESLPVWA